MAKQVNEKVRSMPYNKDAEASVLGSILIDSKASNDIIPIMKEDDFFFSQNRLIFKVMKELQSESIPVDAISVSDKLDSRGKLDEIGGFNYLVELSESIPSAANVEYYSDIVKRDSLKRKVIEMGNSISQNGYESETGSAALEFAEKEIYEISDENSVKSLEKVDNALGTAMKVIQDDQTGNSPKDIVLTDFPGLDKLTHGLKPGELVLIAARPSVGKTAFALNIAANVCLNHAKTVAIFSLEMPSDLLAKRMLSYISKVPLTSMSTRGMMNTQDNAKVFSAYNALLSTNMYIDDYSMNSPSDVLSKCRRLKNETGSLDLVIIDYLQLMTLGENVKTESRQVEVSTMSRKMKIYAKELGVPIILLSQLSRGIEKREDHSPQLSDIRESGSIEQDADIVMFLNNPSRYDKTAPTNQVILDVKKNRNGPIDAVKLEWDGNTTSFREWIDESSPVYVENANTEKGTDSNKNTKVATNEETDSGVQKVNTIIKENAFEPIEESSPFEKAENVTLENDNSKDDGDLYFDQYDDEEPGYTENPDEEDDDEYEDE